ncbi:RICIN domain-containing protein [Rathayibacter sp. VKM Ac-2630]|uniref:RICIN domain-containing protein n=1 Tax=Rathayibacter sp. VKM Ac-2630 TaxID=1938617 RepID=UPI00191C5E6F|nr:RICIN domain-containing protein [Rathayibacter sp. VKM Ac-2630]
MRFTTTSRRSGMLLGAVAVAAALLAGPTITAQAYTPQGGVVYQLGDEPCLKGRGNCIVYPKSVQLPSGRIVAAFEKATVVDYPAPDSIGGAVGERMPIYKSDDNGDTWQPLTELGSPAELSSDPAMDKYSSNWTNPYFYVMPETVGDIAAGTLLLATVVSGEDEFYREQKAANPAWVPDNDGDRRDVSIALYASSNEGADWRFVNIIAAGGWQGGSAGAGGRNVSQANATRQQDPLWEPHLRVHQGKLLAYYSDENDYLDYDRTTGAPIGTPDNATGRDDQGQILAHRTWDGRSASWSAPVVDVSGPSFSFDGRQHIGFARPGMTTVAPTNDGKWLLTFEYFGGGDNVRYKIADDPERFFADGDPDGTDISRLPVAPGSRPLSTGGSPVLMHLPDGRIAYNAAGSGNVWVNDGASFGRWTEYQTPLGGGYSRNLQYDSETGRVLILQSAWGGPTEQPVIRHADVDFGRSAGEYYQLVNRRSGQVLGTNSNTTDAVIGNGDQPDVRAEAADSAANPATQLWHLTAKPGGGTTLLNKAGGRAATVWTGNATTGQRIGQWIDDRAEGQWNIVQVDGTHVRLQSRQNTSLFLTTASAGAPATLQASVADQSQEWRLVPQGQLAGTTRLVNGGSGLCADVLRASQSDRGAVNQWTCNGGTNQQWRVVPRGTNVALVNANSSKCLEVYGFSTQNGAAATQYSCNGGANQLWTRTVAADGTSTYRNVHSGLCLEVQNRSTVSGAALNQWTCNGGTNQQWRP